MKPDQLPVPAAKFEKEFGLSWNKALADGVVFNALDACNVLGVDAAGLDKLWAKAKKVHETYFDIEFVDENNRVI